MAPVFGATPSPVVAWLAFVDAHRHRQSSSSSLTLAGGGWPFTSPAMHDVFALSIFFSVPMAGTLSSWSPSPYSDSVLFRCPAGGVGRQTVPHILSLPRYRPQHELRGLDRAPVVASMLCLRRPTADM